LIPLPTFGSLQARLTAVMIALAVLGAGLPGAWMVYRSYGALRQAAQEGQEALAKSLATTVDGNVSHSLQELEALADRADAKHMDLASLQRTLSLAAAANQVFESLVLLSPQGRVLLQSPLLGAGSLPGRAGLRAFCVDFDQSTEPSPAFFSEPYAIAAGDTAVLLGVPIIRNNKVQAVLAGEVLLTSLGISVENIELGQAGFAYLVDENGTALLKPSGRGPSPGVPPPPDVGELIKKNQDHFFKEYQGRENQGWLLAAYNRIESLNWGVMVRQTADQCYAPARRMLRLLSLYLALALALAVALALLLARAITAPLERLAQAVRLGEKQGLDPADFTGFESRDEVGHLAAALKSLAQELKAQQLEREKAHGRALAAEKRLAEAERLATVGQLAAGLAHEINNPLAVILGSAREAAQARSAKAAAPWLERIEREATRTQRLVRDLLDYARPMRLQRRSSSLAELAARAWQQSRQGRQGEWRLEGAESLPHAKVDPDRFFQVFINLFTNAFDAMPKGGAVQLACAKQDGRLLLNVSDQGPGFPKSKAAALFRPFYTTKPHGTGLGLAIVQRILKAHGGGIRAEASALGKGALFIIDIPS
jgi:signal transduction histidine kinase